MTPRLRELLSLLEAVDADEREDAREATPGDLPGDYVEALAGSGWCGFLSTQSPYVDLWPLRSVISRNAQYRVVPDRDDMLLIGSDGGGTA